jgi:hypothetical protein
MSLGKQRMPHVIKSKPLEAKRKKKKKKKEKKKVKPYLTLMKITRACSKGGNLGQALAQLVLG